MSKTKTVKTVKGVNPLRERIRTIVKEEVRAVLREEMSPWFKKLGNRKNAFAAWIMRQYFNPEKHANKVWYDDSVTQDNVLDYVTRMGESGVFPQSPKSLYELYKLKGQLTASMGQLEKTGELDAVSDYLDDEEEEAEKGTYQTGEVSLKDIGQELGGITPTMVNKLAASAVEKFRGLTQGQSLENIDSDTLDALLKKIQSARSVAASEFAEQLLDAPSVGSFIKDLQKNQVLSPTDVQLIGKEELDGLHVLKSKSPQSIKQILMQDIQDDDNLFKSYQAMVSKKVFPPKKRGRPKKTQD